MLNAFMTLTLFIFLISQDLIQGDSVYVEAKNQLISNEKLNTISIKPVPGEKPEYSSIKNRFSNSSNILMQESSGNGAAPIYKGFRSNKLLYTVNGIRFNNALFKSGNTPYLSLINPIYFNHLNIAEGAVSLLYGSDAIGAALDFSNKNLEKNSFYTGYKSAQKLYYIGLNSQINLENIKNKFSIYHSTSGNLKYGENGNDELLYSSSEQQTKYKQLNIDYDFSYEMKKASVFIGARIARQYDADDFFRIEHKNNLSYKYEPLQWIMYNIGTVYKVTKKSSINAQLYWQKFQEKKTSSAIKNNSLRNDEFNDEISITGFSGIYNSNNQFINFNTGLNFSNEVSDTYGKRNGVFRDGKYPDDSNQKQLGVFFNASHSLSPGVKLNGGLRYSYQRSKILSPQHLDPAVANRLKAYLNDGDYFNNEYKDLTYALSLDYNKDNINNKIIINSSFRAPNFDDLGKLGDNTKIDGLFAIPNYKLKPEKAFNITNQFSTYGTHYTLAIDVFYSRITDLIELRRRGETINISSVDYELAENRNIGKAYLWGGTINYRRFWNSFIYSASLSHQIGQNQVSNKPLSKIPPLRLIQDIKYNINQKISIKALYLFSAKQDRLSDEDKSDSRIIVDGTPAYHKIDLELYYNLGEYKIHLTLENITNQRYRTHSSALNGAGRSINVDFSMDFKI